MNFCEWLVNNLEKKDPRSPQKKKSNQISQRILFVPVCCVGLWCWCLGIGFCFIFIFEGPRVEEKDIAFFFLETKRKYGFVHEPI